MFLGFTYFRQKSDQESIQNINGLLFLTLMQFSLTYIFGVASVCLNFKFYWIIIIVLDISLRFAILKKKSNSN